MKKIFFTLVFALTFQNLVFCQASSNAIPNAVSTLKSLLTDHEIEKAYLQFDRPYPCYVAGDIVYFKAYVTMGERHEPSTISNILHVDLIDKSDVITQSITVQLASGTGWGDFKLPDTLQKGTYRIRAYTEWMRNDKNPYFFDQFISVSSAYNAGRLSQNTTQGLKPDLQFFPEGGNLIVDIPTRIAFKAVGTNGLGLMVRGIVVDDQHKEVAKINATHLGMGMFAIIPEAGRTYKAMVTFADGSQSTVSLPAAQPKGLTLFVSTDDPSKVSIEIRANRDYYKENQNQPLNLLLYYGGAIKRYTPKLDNEVLGLDLPASTFPTGILKISLLSEAGEPISERLAFIQNPDLLNLSIASNKQVYAKREAVQMSFNAKNKMGNPVNGSFSVSVVDESKIAVDENAENSILSYLLLTTEVKGYIEKPNYYFTNITKESRAALDALMLTQGYRRFTWKELEASDTNTAATTFSPEKGIDVAGVLKTKGGEPIANCPITLFDRTGGGIVAATTDKDGRFRFADIPEGSRFVLKIMTAAGRNSVLTLDKPTPAPPIADASPAEQKYDANADILASFEGDNNGGQTVVTASTTSESVMLKDEKVASANPSDNYRSSNLGGPGHANQVIPGSAVNDAASLSIVLAGLAHGVTFNNGVPALRSEITINGSMGGTQAIEPMLLVVDGVNLGKGASIDDINPNSVETIEVLKGANAAIYGMDGGSGVMVITTKTRLDYNTVTSTQMSPGIFSIEPKGFYKAREFYSPKYDAGQVANNLPDHRTTIFWKPDLTTDADGNASFSFYNADGTGTYRVEVEGIDSKGNLGMQVFRYKVQ